MVMVYITDYTVPFVTLNGLLLPGDGKAIYVIFMRLSAIRYSSFKSKSSRILDQGYLKITAVLRQNAFQLNAEGT
jgi:hypothetical protein